MASFAQKGVALFDDLRRRRLLCAFLVGYVLAIFLIGRLAFSGFSILDDHDILEWLDKSVWGRIGATEIAQYGYGSRFRPVMYLVLIFESLLFGDHPMPYHVAEILWFGLFLSAFAWASFRSVGVFAGLFLLLLIATGRYWGNIWTHSLFAAEQLGSVGIGLIIFGGGLVSSWFTAGRGGSLDRAVLLVGTGSLVCVGSKEYFLPMIPLDIALLAVAWRQKAMTTCTLVAGICLLIVQFAICFGIVSPNLHQLSNVNNGTGLSARIAAIFHVKRLALRIYLAWAGGITAGISAAAGRGTRPLRETRELIVLSGLLLWSGLYVAWGQFFYNGMLPTGYRYDFPTLLIDPILAGSAFFVVMRLRSQTGWTGRQFSPLALQIFFAQACLLWLFWPVGRIIPDPGNLFPLRAATRVSNDHTGAMSRDLGLAKKLAAQHPDWPIIIRTTRVADYETVLTFPDWLKYFRISNPASIEVDIPASAIHSSVEEGMFTGMRDRSVMGVAGQYLPRNQAIQRAEAEGHCYITQFEDRETRCVRLPYHPGAYYPVEQG